MNAHSHALLRPSRSAVLYSPAARSPAALLGALALLAACAAGERTRDDGSSGPNNASITPYNGGPAPANTSSEQNVSSTSGTAASETATPDPTETSEGNAGNELPLVGFGQLGSATMGGSGSTNDRWHKTDVTRNGQNYFLMANGWGPGFASQSLSWNGTAFTVESMTGSQGPDYQPASYPTVFCGVYSDSRSQACGLPAALDSIQTLRTGWSWRANGNDGQYNAAYDIWLGTGETRASFSGFLMVWYREPVGQQPAGSPRFRDVSVANVPGTWDIWVGTVNNAPIINWVRGEGEDTPDMEFDVLDFVRDAEQRGLQVPGTHVLSVAVGFEIWNGPVTKLESVDFYVDVQ